MLIIDSDDGHVYCSSCLDGPGFPTDARLRSGQFRDQVKVFHPKLPQLVYLFPIVHPGATRAPHPARNECR